MTIETGLAPRQAPSPTRQPLVQQGGGCPNRSAASTVGFLSGWVAAGVCDFGIIPAALTGFGVGGSYVGSSVLWGLGWVPVVGVFAAAMVLGFSYLICRRAWATLPREIAVRTYWSTVRTTAFAGGISFVLWILLGMSIIYGVGGGAMHG